MKGFYKYDLGYDQVVIIETEKELSFLCNSIKLDASYNKENGKIKGKGSKSCKNLILKMVEEIKKEEA